MIDATHTVLGLLCLAIFIFSYLLVMSEEILNLRKSQSVVFSAGLIWVLVAIACQYQGMPLLAKASLSHHFLEYSELLLFLITAMTYLSALAERNVFEALQALLRRYELSFKQLFWSTGFLAFIISPFADNLTTALLMGAVLIACGEGNKQFICLGCINIVSAANAGGAFSPFGDITTLMVWQKGLLPFSTFLHLVLPALVSFIVPATCMHFAIPSNIPPKTSVETHMKPGAKTILFLFVLTIFTAVLFHQFLHLPPVIGMMTGLGYLNLFAFYLQHYETRHEIESQYVFDIFKKYAEIEWDTLLFFYGIMMCVGGLATLGYLELLSNKLYHDWLLTGSTLHAVTPANIIVGLVSAVIDNIPVMYAVLTMKPTMSAGQWMLVTLTTGIGGSLLSIGSAAGVALMGQARGYYTFLGHLKWLWALALGYFAAIACHLWLNAGFFVT